MSKFMTTQEIRAKFNQKETDKRKCEILFPDETIVRSAELIRTHICGSEFYLRITIHGAKITIGEGYFEDLRFKFID